MKSRPHNVKSILKEMLERNKYYGPIGEDSDPLHQIETMNHWDLIEICNLLGFDDLYDNHKHQEYISRQASRIVQLIQKEVSKSYEELTEDDSYDL